MTINGKTVATLAAIMLLWPFSAGLIQPAFAGVEGPLATITTWAVGADPTIVGLDPHETVADPSGLTNEVGAPAMATSMENTQGGSCGILIWNPDTNAFMSWAVTGGFQFAIDMNRGSTADLGFGAGDLWATVNGNGGFSPYVKFAGSDDFRRYSVGASSATGIRVNSDNGKVYLGNFGTAGIFELDPSTNAVKMWDTESKPYNLALDDTFVWATGVAGGDEPDQILRLNPATNELKRWDVPGGGFQSFISFGTPNSITKDLEGNVWFTESASDQLGRLNPTTNDIDEFTKVGIENPHAIASSGSGATLQAFFTEADGASISLITESEATPTTTKVTPTTETITPTESTVTPVDFKVTPVTATITPATFDSEGVDPSGIVRFPIPPGTLEPTGMTGVVFTGTVFGSMEGSDHVFKLKSEAIIAPPPGEEVPVVGGEIVSIDTTALFVAGAFTNAFWILPILAGIAGATIFVTRFRRKARE